MFAFLAGMFSLLAVFCGIKFASSVKMGVLKLCLVLTFEPLVCVA